MKLLSSLRFTVRSLLFSRAADEALDAEIEDHIARQTAEHVRLGLPEAEARRKAFAEFGGVQRYREECRDVRRTSWIDEARSNLRFATRLIDRHRGFSGNIITISALGVLATATTFSLVGGIMLSPLPFSGADRIVSLQLASADGSSAAIPIEAYHRIANDTSIVEAIAASTPDNTVIDVRGEPEQVRTEWITTGFLRVYGIRPALGRSFGSDEASIRAPVVMLGHDAWRSRFGGDSAIVGRTISLDGASHRVVGVMPPGFRATRVTEPVLWRPYLAGTASTGGRLATTNAVLRIREGVDAAHVERWLATFLTGSLRSTGTADSLRAFPALVPVADLIYGDVRRPLLVLLGAVLLVLMLVTANVGTLFLARAVSRGRELMVRRALGASSARQVRLLMTESLLLTGLGGLAGTIAAWWAVSSMRVLGAGILPRIENVALDWRVVLATVAATMLVGVVSGIPPAVVMRESAAGTPRATHRFARMSNGLVIAQIALSVVLLVGAGLLTKGFLRVLPDDPGFALENRATVSMRLRGRNALPDSGSVQRFAADVASRMRQIEGVRDVAVTSYLPFVMMFSLADIRLPGRAESDLTAFHSTISPNYFAVMEMPLRAGRAFTDADRAGAARTLIVNESAARKWFGSGNAVGRRVEYTDAGRSYSATIVGVVRDARLSGTDTRVRPEIYAPLAQGNPRMLSFVAATQDDPRFFDRRLKQAVWAVAPRLPVEATSDLATLASRSVSEPRFFAASISIFAIAAAILATIGIYGVVSFAVTQRRQEIGIRIALGATGARITAMIARRAILFGVGGIVIGLGVARGLSHFLEGLLLEVTATDAGVFGAIGTGMMVLAVIAGCVPAWQALRSDPVKAIRMP